ncbi:MAG TPA: ABC transporter ATP-binding protein [Actinomycetota bacterium]|nr:ABC transporter ATP-binding protein [Actinomycetota bacterium]
MAEITLEGLTKIFRDGSVGIDDVHLTVPDGSLFVFVGPSGCGKTTLLRLVAGLEEPTEGRIVLGGDDVTDLSPRDRDVAMIFQNYALYPHMTAFENIAFGLRSRKMDKEDVGRRVARVASVLGLGPVLKKRPRQLSGGQRQRVALGRAIVRQPQVFLMDEPLSDLDAHLRDQMRGEIRSLQRDLGVTTLYVTHDQAEALTIGDHVAVMDEGLIHQIGTAHEVYERPVDLFVASFLGAPPMNLAEATIERDGGGSSIRLGADRIPVIDEVGLTPGRPVIVGIRPEHLRPARSGDDPASVLSVRVDRSEQVGATTDLWFAVDAPTVRLDRSSDGDAADEGTQGSRPHRFVARVGSEHGSTGALDLFVDRTRVHLFDPSTELAIR